MKSNYGTDVQEVLLKIEQHVVERLILFFKPKSIIVSGTFGRNEVSVTNINGDIQLLSDLEINPIGFRYISPSKTRKIISEMKDRYNIDVSINGTKLSLLLLVPGLAKHIKPTIQYYDLKNGSRVVYGTNYLTKIPNFKPEDIPFSEGVKLIFNRIAENLDSQASSTSDTKLVYSDFKIILACQDACLLSKHLYSSSYRTRNLLFSQIPIEFVVNVSEFTTMARTATNYKLNSSGINVNPEYIHTKALEICDNVLSWAVSGCAGDRVVDWISVCRYYTRLQGIGELITTVKRNMLKLIEIFLFNRRNIYPRLVLRFNLPWTKLVYATLALVYFSQPVPKQYNRAYLKETRRILSPLVSLDKPSSDPGQEYEILRKKALELWYAICY